MTSLTTRSGFFLSEIENLGRRSPVCADFRFVFFRHLNRRTVRFARRFGSGRDFDSRGFRNPPLRSAHRRRVCGNPFAFVAGSFGVFFIRRGYGVFRPLLERAPQVPLDVLLRFRIRVPHSVRGRFFALRNFWSGGVLRHADGAEPDGHDAVWSRMNLRFARGIGSRGTRSVPSAEIGIRGRPCHRGIHERPFVFQGFPCHY